MQKPFSWSQTLNKKNQTFCPGRLSFFFNRHFEECLHPSSPSGLWYFIFFNTFYGYGRQNWDVWMVGNLILQRHLLPHEEIWRIYETILLCNPLSPQFGHSDLDLTSTKHQQSDFTYRHKKAGFLTIHHKNR